MTDIEKIFTPFVELLDPETRGDMMIYISDLRKEHGDAWRNYFDTEHPDLVILVDLAANKTADEAMPLFKAHAVGLLNDAGVWGFELLIAQGLVRGWCNTNEMFLRDMHRYIRAEIDKPRF